VEAENRRTKMAAGCNPPTVRAQEVELFFHVVGGVVSPILANIFLHHVVDVWFEEVVKPRLQGRGFMVRYADDLVIVVEKEIDAERVMKALADRLGRYGLRLHPEKTRIVRFQRPILSST
jgi:retron-type reverse transcriptase